MNNSIFCWRLHETMCSQSLQRDDFTRKKSRLILLRCSSDEMIHVSDESCLVSNKPVVYAASNGERLHVDKLSSRYFSTIVRYCIGLRMLLEYNKIPCKIDKWWYAIRVRHQMSWPPANKLACISKLCWGWVKHRIVVWRWTRQYEKNMWLARSDLKNKQSFINND